MTFEMNQKRTHLKVSEKKTYCGLVINRYRWVTDKVEETRCTNCLHKIVVTEQKLRAAYAEKCAYLEKSLQSLATTVDDLLEKALAAYRGPRME